jgi:hypothetical protein
MVVAGQETNEHLSEALDIFKHDIANSPQVSLQYYL